MSDAWTAVYWISFAVLYAWWITRDYDDDSKPLSDLTLDTPNNQP